MLKRKYDQAFEEMQISIRGRHQLSKSATSSFTMPPGMSAISVDAAAPEPAGSKRRRALANDEPLFVIVDGSFEATPMNTPRHSPTAAQAPDPPFEVAVDVLGEVEVIDEQGDEEDRGDVLDVGGS